MCSDGFALNASNFAEVYIGDLRIDGGKQRWQQRHTVTAEEKGRSEKKGGRMTAMIICYTECNIANIYS